MKKRVISALGMFAVLVLLFVSKIWTPYVFDAGIGILMVLAGYEMSNLLLKMGLYNYTIVAGAFPVALYALTLVLILKQVDLLIVFASIVALILVFVILTFISTLIFKKWLSTDLRIRKIQMRYSSFALRKTVYSTISLIYPTVFLFFLVFINHIGELSYALTKVSLFANVDISFIVLIIAFLIPIISDTFAMLCGSVLKGPKLCPKTSPNKTISGFVCGVIMTTLILVALYFVLYSFADIKTAFDASGLTLIHFAMLGFFGSIISTLGDIFESLLKRRATVKDSGDIIPGHGGILDRLDSHIANAPFVFVYFLILLL